ncbi:uncharacterized protein EDB91DRAFT_1302770 [Suillus paluster]|uniref:uncharacterized protein n=1 Tax=Suillus paluster TaxID=48578 RepID=UPI001B8617A7|nr:uncharacterized protein EDB91DRAFT_1302770 [Suillus paluster]KAG1732227.1 hypothetical protein EDB91DRAFT_1302770 [Suillus paluster]
MVRSFGTTVAGPRRMDTGSRPYRVDAEPHYLSLDKGSSHCHPTVQRRQSAKQLINRYESISREESSTARGPPSAARFLGASPSSRSHGRGKRRSLSASLRNFLSVFQKGRKGKDADDSEEDVPAVVIDAPSMAHIPSMYTNNAAVTHDAGAMVLSAGEVSALHSGALLYLSKSSSPITSPILPVWTSCTVTLHTSHILITWYTVHANPSSHVIPLDGCTDVRSIALNRLDPDEKALLPNSTDKSEPKVFELLFEGRRREKLTASSSRERARWVSAIWDALLQRQSQGATRQKALTIQTNLQREGQNYLQPPSASEYTSSEYTSSSGVESESSLTTEQSLPPTPSIKSPLSSQSPARFSLHDSPQNCSPMSILPPRPPSQISPRSSGPKSPSIAKLGNLSVVTQRLAQIEQTNSPVSASSASTLPHLQGAQTIRPTRARRAFAEIQRFKEEGFSSDSPLTSGRPSPLPRSPASIETYSSRSRSAFIRSRTSLTPAPTLPDTPRVAKEDLPSTPSPPPTFDIDLQLVPMTELIKKSAAMTFDQTAGISEQIVALQRDVLHLPSELAPLMADTIKQSSTEAKEAILSTVKALAARVEDIHQQSSSSTVQLQVNSIMKILDVMQTQLKSNLPRVLDKLDVIHHNQEREMSMSTSRTSMTAMNNLRPPFSGMTSPTESLAPFPNVDLSDVYVKLDELTSLYKTGNTPLSPATRSPHEDADIPEHKPLDDKLDFHKLKAVLDYLNADEEQKKVQLEQQADSIRYLNELNSWLDAFVNNGTTQIQAVATGVEQLCKQLGVNTSEELSSLGLTGQVQQLLEAAQNQADSGDNLRSIIHELIQVVQEHLTHGDEQRKTLELTEEIRGERLRFVEAMKEATAINVQGAFILSHVEHFKAELGREVSVMTQDVGRLHKEKQAIEQQIADLFAFYSKQKQEAEVCLMPRISFWD